MRDSITSLPRPPRDVRACQPIQMSGGGLDGLTDGIGSNYEGYVRVFDPTSFRCPAGTDSVKGLSPRLLPRDRAA